MGAWMACLLVVWLACGPWTEAFPVVASAVKTAPSQHDDLSAENNDSQSERGINRRHLLYAMALIPLSGGAILRQQPSLAFEGGIGGLGKTKPSTGVVLWNPESAPLQNQRGIVTAELNVLGQPVLVTFQTPWPLLPTTGGLEARDLQNAESAFVQVVTNNDATEDPKTKPGMVALLQNSVLSQQGKFGAYQTPVDVKVKRLQVEDEGTSVVGTVTFTTFTPGLRESERQIFVDAVPIGKNRAWILLVVGTTRQRFAQQEATLQRVVDSFEVILAPPSSSRR
jgi:hypothetical protein